MIERIFHNTSRLRRGKGKIKLRSLVVLKSGIEQYKSFVKLATRHFREVKSKKRENFYCPG